MPVWGLGCFGFAWNRVGFRVFWVYLLGLRNRVVGFREG